MSLFTSSFETSNATEPEVASNVLFDPQNEAIEKFMEQNKEYVNKIWDEHEQQLRESNGISNIEEDMLAPEDVPSDQIESLQEELVAVLQESIPPIPAPKKRGRKPKVCIRYFFLQILNIFHLVATINPIFSTKKARKAIKKSSCASNQ